MYGEETYKSLSNVTLGVETQQRTALERIASHETELEARLVKVKRLKYLLTSNPDLQETLTLVRETGAI